MPGEDRRLCMFLATDSGDTTPGFFACQLHGSSQAACANPSCDADRVRDDFDGSAAFRLWIVIEPVFRQIDDNALVRPGGKYAGWTTICLPAPAARDRCPD